MLTGLRIARAIAATDPLRREIEREERPGIDITRDDELLSYIRSSASSVYHACGNCKMGSGLDAVVDSRLRLRGVEGLVV
ncbi:GMC oxidoreductase, partial [Rhizobium johnstonii]|uniref:GMC oxidoreductase n=1 Tax=Rhizobium johnstonii TaxID=3019933 RepID=UPI003F948CB4